MAWPLTRRTTYVNDSPPPIDADDLNAIQDEFGKTYRGETSFKGITIDGTGGAAVTSSARRIDCTGGDLTLAVEPGQGAHRSDDGHRIERRNQRT
jgi:hypothetical protein